MKQIEAKDPIRCSTFWAKIYIAGPIDIIEQTCREFVLKGGCVTVTPTNYIYTMGEESGAEIGLIHYPRFAKTFPSPEITNEAMVLGHELLYKCHQGSFTIMTPTDTFFISRRKEEDPAKEPQKGTK